MTAARRNPARPFVLRANNLRGWRFELDNRKAPELRGLDFDECYVGDWFGMERMDHRMWWVRIGDLNFMVHVPANGSKPVWVSEPYR